MTYFGEETQTAAREAGLGGFWLGYFAFRAAPLGRASAALATSTFHNFAPGFVDRWLPAAWASVDPQTAIVHRAAAAAATLRRIVPDIDDVADAVGPALQAAIDHAPTGGRPLFAANRAVPRPDDPVAALWQRCTDLREHRGDGHVAALTAAGIDGLEAHVLLTLDQGTDPTRLQQARGWAPDDWAAAVARLRTRGLVATDDDVLTPGGADLRTQIEVTTDRLATTPWLPSDPAPDPAQPPASLTAAIAQLTPAADAVWASGLLPSPNPIGLPPIR